MSKLKQNVTLEVWSEIVGGDLILDATGLRIDFDINHIPGYARAKFEIYNLTEEAVRNLMSGERYVTLKTQLHDGKVQTLAKRFHISNAIDELKLPNRITSLYCFDNLRGTFLDQELNETVLKPTLKRSINHILDKLKFKGPREFLSFPEGLMDEAGLKGQRPMQGTLLDILLRLGREFNFMTHTKNGGLSFMYLPDDNNVSKTDLGTRDVITLNTRSMRSNPQIGMATCKINSNLDGRITPTTLIDLSKLLTVSTLESDEALSVTNGLTETFSRNSRYQAFAVQHKGSNYTEEWSTIISGLAPTKGKLLSTVTWASPTYNRS